MKPRVEHRSQSTEWETPQALFDALHLEFGFTLDPAATRGNAKLPRYFTKAEDGLIQSWAAERVFCNPPYGRKITGRWVEKCAQGGGAASRCPAAVSHGHALVPRLHPRQGRNPLHQRPAQVRRGEAWRAVPIAHRGMEG